MGKKSRINWTWDEMCSVQSCKLGQHTICSATISAKLIVTQSNKDFSPAQRGVGPLKSWVPRIPHYFFTRRRSPKPPCRSTASTDIHLEIIGLWESVVILNPPRGRKRTHATSAYSGTRCNQPVNTFTAYAQNTMSAKGARLFLKAESGVCAFVLGSAPTKSLGKCWHISRWKQKSKVCNLQLTPSLTTNLFAGV